MAQLININSTEFRRCNLSAIQSGGTWASIVPDSNEIILISTTNALTADGSGECDAYIMGDGTTAASELEIKNIGSGGGGGGTTTDGDVLEFTEYMDFPITTGFALMTSGAVRAEASSCVSDFIEVSAGEKIYITARGRTNYASYVFYDSAQNPTGDYSVAEFDANNNTEIIVPNGASYIRLGNYLGIALSLKKLTNGYGNRLIGNQWGLVSEKSNVGKLDGETTDSRYACTDYIPMKVNEKFLILPIGYESNSGKTFAIYDTSKTLVASYGGMYNVPEVYKASSNGYFRVGILTSTANRNQRVYIYKYGLKNAGEKRYIPRTIQYVAHSFEAGEGRADSIFGTTIRRVGLTTLIQECFKVDGFVRRPYDGNSLGASSASDTLSIALKMGDWTGTDGDVWLLDTMTNDFKRNIPLGTTSDFHDNTGATTYFGALRMFADKVESLSGMPIVIAANASHRNNSGYTSTSQNTQGLTLNEYSNALMEVCAIKGWHFVDVFNYGGITDENLSATTVDGLHPNAIGYRQLFRVWKQTLDIVYDNLRM